MLPDVLRCERASERGGGGDEGVEEAALGASREPAFPIWQWHLLRGTWASEFRSFALLLGRALTLPRHNFAYTLATRHNRLSGGLSAFWGLSRSRTGYVQLREFLWPTVLGPRTQLEPGA